MGVRSSLAALFSSAAVDTMTEDPKTTKGAEETTNADETFVTREVVGADIRVTHGPDAGTRHQLDEPSLTIGKGPLAGLRLSDQAVSREHLRVELTPTGLLVRDAGSKNGTWMGAVRIDAVTLTADATLRIGATTLVVTVHAKPVEVLLSATERFGDAYARSLPMRHLFAKLEQAARSDISVLLEGESGVGKELLARGVHQHSSRSAGPFVPIDCGAIPPELIESELFGHERGAFTGADRVRIGPFEQAHGGTVFLDEIGELPIELQPKLLRVLQEREVRRVGAAKAHPIDIRVVAATNKNLKDRCAEGAFRDDLYYRLAQFRVRVPSLRERTEDVGPLATSFLRELTNDPQADLPADILAMLTAYQWPGNVRELRNVVTRFSLLDVRDRRELFDVSATSLHEALPAEDDDLSSMTYHDARRLVIERFEARYFPAVIARADGVRSRAAELAGLARSSFYRMLDRVGGGESDPDG